MRNSLWVSSSHGDGCSNRSDGAVTYLKLAANQNHSDAQCAWKCCHNIGEDDPIDRVRPANYVKLAANQNNSHAQLVHGGRFDFSAITDPQLIRHLLLLEANAALSARSN
jgi:TPR repeat protein